MIYFLTAMKPEKELAEQVGEEDGTKREKEKAQLRLLAEKGGFVAACIRVMIAVAGRDRIMDVREFQEAEGIIQTHEKLKVLTPGEFKMIAREQANLLAILPQQALDMHCDR